MRDVLKRQEALHDAWGIVTPNRPLLLTPDRVRLKRRLLAEEVGEADDAMETGRRTMLSELPEESALMSIAKELADVVVVTAGAALEYGIPLDRVLIEVMASNESKLGPARREVATRDSESLLGWTRATLHPVRTCAFAAFDGHLCESCAATTTVAALVREATEEES